AGVVPYRRNLLNIAVLILFCLSGIPAFAQTLTVVRPSRHAQSPRLSDIRGGAPAVNGPTEIKLFRANRLNGVESGSGGGTLPDPTIQTSLVRWSMPPLGLGSTAPMGFIPATIHRIAT